MTRGKTAQSLFSPHPEKKTRGPSQYCTFVKWGQILSFCLKTKLAIVLTCQLEIEHTNQREGRLQELRPCPLSPPPVFLKLGFGDEVCVCVCVKEPFKLQLRVFLEEVQQQIQIPTIRR